MEIIRLASTSITSGFVAFSITLIMLNRANKELLNQNQLFLDKLKTLTTDFLRSYREK
jgi:hypothetical protein